MTLIQELKAGNTILLFGNRFDISAVHVGTQGVTIEGIEHTHTIFEDINPLPSAFTTVLGELFEVVGQHLTSVQKEAVRHHYREWSGGFDANEEMPEQVESYLESAVDTTLPFEAVKAFVLAWADE